MKLIEKIFYYIGVLPYGLTYFIKVAVKKALEETLSQMPLKKSEPTSIYEDSGYPTINEMNENEISKLICTNCKEKSMRIEKIKCSKCGAETKLTPLWRGQK